MFTGIIEDIGEIISIRHEGESAILTISSKKIMDDVKVLIENDNLNSYVNVVTSSKMDSVEIAAALLKMMREK